MNEHTIKRKKKNPRFNEANMNTFEFPKRA